MNGRGILLVLTAVAAVGLGGCKTDDHGGHRDHRAKAATHAEHAHASAWAAINEAIAVLHPTQGNEARGWVRFHDLGNGRVRITGEVSGLTANGTHGFHIHEFGDCSAPDATSAGGHYNPEGHPHAGPDAAQRHAGDLGNLQADGRGTARVDLTVDNITIAGLKNPVIGRGVIVHTKADDLTSQPTGDAGGRIACGVIGVAQKK